VRVQDTADICVSNKFRQFAALSERNLATTFPYLWLDEWKAKRLIDVLLGFSCHELPARVQAALVERHSILGASLRNSRAGSASTVGEAIGREVIYKPIVIADFRRQLEQFGLPGGPGFEP
jgi:hypothetical protein